MADPKPRREDQIDEQYRQKFNPYNLSEQEGEAAKQADRDRNFEEKQYGIPQDGSSTDEARRQEEAATTMGLYTGSGKPEAKETVSLKTVFKKKGPLGALIALGLGLPTILTIMLSPALLLQQIAETMTGEFNDQLAALDARSTLLLKKKLNSSLLKGSCGKVTIACRYQSMRKGSGLAKRLDKAGIKVIGDDSIIPGRTKPTHFEFEGNRIQAKDLLNEARKNPALRSALRKGYDPLYAAFSDKLSTKIRDKVGLKRSSNVNSSSDKDKMNDDLKKTAAGDVETPEGKLTPGERDKDGKILNYVDEAGNEFTPAQASLIEEGLGKAALGEAVEKAAVKASVKSALTATALGLGAVDSLCTGWVVLRVASFAAKVYQQRQLIRYAYEFMKVAHEQKYGDLTAEKMEIFGDKLTSINSEGKAALDSAGYKFAAYGDTFKVGDYNAKKISDTSSPEAEAEAERLMVQNETSRYVNGQLINDNIMTTLVNLLAKGKEKTVEAADDACKFVKSWKGQAILVGAALVGIIAGIFSGGSTIGLGAIANGAAAVAVSVAFALVQPKLLDMVKGEVIKGDENGNETGNAIASGMGGYNAHTAPGRGLGVATQTVYAEYKTLNEKVIAKNAEIDRSELSPFDISSKNTFLGSLVSNILPFTTKVSSLGSASLATSSFVSSSFASIGTKQAVYAAGEKDKYSKCDDNEYKGLAADPFCNLRYAIPKADLEIDPDDVLSFMLSKNHCEIDPVTGEPVMDLETEDPNDCKKIYEWIESPSDATPKGDYEDYINKCFKRKDSIGDPNSDEGKGTECIIGKGGSNEERNKMFRLFYIDTSAYDGMDEDFESEGGTSSEATAAGDLNLTIATFNIYHSEEKIASVWKARLDKSIKVITDNGVGVAGLQEARSDQQIELMKADKLGGSYGIFPTETKQPNNSPNPIIWDKSKYTLVKDGTELFDIEYDYGNKNNVGVQVKLRDNTTGATFYVLNTHDPANVRLGSDATNAQSRVDNAETYVQRVKQLSSEGLPIFLTGDFNSRYNAGPHCTISSSGVVKDTWELYKNIKGCANNRPLGTEIDRIYTSKQGTVEKMWTAAKGVNNNGSDVHDTLIATVSFIGEGGGASGEVTWPLDKKWWISKQLDFLNAHGMDSGTFTSPYVKGLATDISSVPDGSPVYSMLSGSVTRSDACAVIVKSTVSGGTLYTAYGHTTDRIGMGANVTAGQQIGKLGNSFDGGCSSTGGHLHIDMSLYVHDGPDGRHICPQDVFLALNKGESVNWAQLTAKAAAPCGRKI